MAKNIHTAEIYTDGSCHTQLRKGAWAAIIFTQLGRQTLTGTEQEATHNRMELTAVIKAIEYVQANWPDITHLDIYTDSQYVTMLPGREHKLTEQGFRTAKGNERNNTELLKRLLQLSPLFTTAFIKVKAHQKKGGEADYNREADMLCRQLVRESVSGK